jgi:carbon storage regulator
MLILSRKLNESIVIDGRITVKLVRIDGEVIKLGITAPADVPVHRQEVYEEIRLSNEAAAAPNIGPVPKLSAPQRASSAALGLQPLTEMLPAKP